MDGETMAEYTWWALTVVVPVVALVSYWLMSRRQVARAMRELEQKLDAERQITARVSHRLRNPLTVIYGFSETLLDSDLNDMDEVRSVARILSAEALDVSRTVEDLVASNEILRNDLEVRVSTFDPATEVERAVLPFRRLGAEVSVESWSGSAVSDPVRFRQIVQNLVSNAVRYGGPEITVVADIRGSEYHCTVADNGDGLPGEVEMLPFSPSGPIAAESVESPEADVDAVDRVDSANEERSVGATGTNDGALAVDPTGQDGLGLGLAVAGAVATSLGGSLSYERLDGVSMFTMILPTSGWPGPLEPMNPAIPDVVHDGTDNETDSEAEGDDLPDDPIDPHDDLTVSFDDSAEVHAAPTDDADTISEPADDDADRDESTVDATSTS